MLITKKIHFNNNIDVLFFEIFQKKFIYFSLKEKNIVNLGMFQNMNKEKTESSIFWREKSIIESQLFSNIHIFSQKQN